MVMMMVMSSWRSGTRTSTRRCPGAINPGTTETQVTGASRELLLLLLQPCEVWWSARRRQTSVNQ